MGALIRDPDPPGKADPMSTPKTMTVDLAQLFRRAATPRGKRAPLGGVFSATATALEMTTAVRYVRHACVQTDRALRALRSAFPDDGEVDDAHNWHRGADGSGGGWSGLLTDIEQRATSREGVYSSADLQAICREAVEHLEAIAPSPRVVIARDDDLPLDPQLQWYFVDVHGAAAQPAGAEEDADTDADAAAADEEGEADGAVMTLQAAPAEAAEDADTDPPPETLADWYGPFPDLEGYESVRLAGVTYRRDPLSAQFTDLPDDELELLAGSIDAEGQRLPVVINTATDTVLDGWQRLRALRSIERAPCVERLQIDNPTAYVMAVNVHRRYTAQQSAAQRVLLALDLFAAEGGKRAPSAKRVAAAAGCSTGPVDQVRRARKYDAKHGTAFIATLRAGRKSAKAVNDEIDHLERVAANGDGGGDGDADTPERAERKSRSELEALLAGAEEDAQIAAEEHAAELQRVQDARKSAEQERDAARETLGKLSSSDDAARALAALTEERDALRSQVETLQAQAQELERERDAAREQVATVRAVMTGDDDTTDLYAMLGVQRSGVVQDPFADEETTALDDFESFAP